MAQAKIKQLEAELVSAKQDVHIMQQDVVAATQKIQKEKSEEAYAKYMSEQMSGLADQNAVPVDVAHQWQVALETDVS